MKNYKRPTVKQFKFILQTCHNWSTQNAKKVEKLISTESEEDVSELMTSQFEYLMAEMLKSTDDEIRVELPRFLMFGGFTKFIDFTVEYDILKKIAKALS